MIEYDIFLLTTLFGGISQAEDVIMNKYNNGEISEKLMCAYIQELDSYY